MDRVKLPPVLWVLLGRRDSHEWEIHGSVIKIFTAAWEFISSLGWFCKFWSNILTFFGPSWLDLMMYSIHGIDGFLLSLP